MCVEGTRQPRHGCLPKQWLPSPVELKQVTADMPSHEHPLGPHRFSYSRVGKSGVYESSPHRPTPFTVVSGGALPKVLVASCCATPPTKPSWRHTMAAARGPKV